MEGRIANKEKIDPPTYWTKCVWEIYSATNIMSIFV